ncbi:MAG TPA: GNAT family N-acetyltransferase [Candidatus Paceibacterota bacterium]
MSPTVLEESRKREGFNPKIRRATLEDIPDILRLNLQLFQLEKKEFDPTLDETWVARVGPSSFSKRIESANGFVEVVEYEGKVIGYICGALVKSDSYRREGVYAELENMLIEEEFRGRGIGSLLVADFDSWCKSQGVNISRVVASYKNTNAINTYNNAGYSNHNIVLEKEIKPFA